MSKKILIADDEANIVISLEFLMLNSGYQIQTAANGEEAFSKAVKFLPQLIILDIMMPKMDGTEVAMVLKHDVRTKHIPIFFVTAVISPEDQAKVSGSPNPIFAKPVKLEELLTAINGAILKEPA